MNFTWKVLIGIITVWFVATLVISDGKRYCSDGTTTYSSGSGTCSWHGGKGSQPAKKIANYLFFAALGVWVYISFFRGRQASEPVPPKPIPTPQVENPTSRTRPPVPSRPLWSGQLSQSVPPRVRPKPVPADFLPPPPCPECGEITRLRMARKGRNRGHYFWGCTRYPSCMGTIDCTERVDRKEVPQQPL